MLHYNFPPYSVGETGRMARAGPARNRPWQARLARDPPDAADRGGIPLYDPHRLGDHRIERLVLDGDRLRLLARSDGRGRSVEAADRGHRDGPDPRGQALRRSLGHSGRRRSSRRHGFQGRRHDRGRHLAADGHQDRRHHRGDHEGRARPGEGRAPAYPRRNEQGADRRARRARRIRAAHRDDENPDRQDPRSHRHRRQGHPRNRREDRRQDQHRGRRHGQDRFGRRRQDQGRRQLDQIDRLRSGNRP